MFTLSFLGRLAEGLLMYIIISFEKGWNLKSKQQKYVTYFREVIYVDHCDSLLYMYRQLSQSSVDSWVCLQLSKHTNQYSL